MEYLVLLYSKFEAEITNRNHFNNGAISWHKQMNSIYIVW